MSNVLCSIWGEGKVGDSQQSQRMKHVKNFILSHFSRVDISFHNPFTPNFVNSLQPWPSTLLLLYKVPASLSGYLDFFVLLLILPRLHIVNSDKIGIRSWRGKRRIYPWYIYITPSAQPILSTLTNIFHINVWLEVRPSAKIKYMRCFPFDRHEQGIKVAILFLLSLSHSMHHEENGTNMYGW